MPRGILIFVLKSISENILMQFHTFFISNKCFQHYDKYLINPYLSNCIDYRFLKLEYNFVNFIDSYLNVNILLLNCFFSLLYAYNFLKQVKYCKAKLLFNNFSCENNNLLNEKKC